MSEHALPEDLRQWPADPYRLLGVTHGVGPRDLKRAYTRLIRTFKPEQFPEHFRRIREAYENVLRFVEIFGAPDIAPEPSKGGTQAREESVAAPQTNEPQRDEIGQEKEEKDESVDLPVMRQGLNGDAPPAMERLHSPNEECSTAKPPARPERDDPASLWQLAVDGHDAAAYCRLRVLDQRQPGRAEVCLPLYWLLVLNPALEPQRAPADWLVHGLLHNGLGGPLRELYRREIADDPREATSPRCTRLLELELPAAAAADLLEWRWQAAGRLGHYWIIAEDIQRLRARMLRDDEETWVRLLFSAVEQLSAMCDPGRVTLLIRQLRDELKQFEHLQGRLADALDRHEFLLEVARGLEVLRREPGIPPLFLELLPLSWTQPFPEVRPLLLRFLNDVAGQPWTFLKLFTRIQAQSSAALAQYGNLLLMLRATVPDIDETRSAEELAHPIRQFLTSGDWDGYLNFSGELLGFCLRDVVAPEQVAEAVAPQDDALAQRITDDWPLRYVWLSCRLFWA